jgi:hypothetical protein
MASGAPPAKRAINRGAFAGPPDDWTCGWTLYLPR